MANRSVLEQNEKDQTPQKATVPTVPTVPAVSASASATEAAGEGADEAVEKGESCSPLPPLPPLLNVRHQRLDQWLSSNTGRGLRAAVAFFDYETGWAGRPKVKLSPLRDVQRFLRCGFAADTCLLGLTLSFRAPHYSKYAGPQLAVADVEGFVVAEAAACGFECAVLETVNYGMSFMLFLLTRRPP